MRKYLTFFLCALVLGKILFAQDENEDEGPRMGFHKENLFTGGNIALSFFNGAFLVGANPVFGCSLTKWLDVGIVGNYTYTSYNSYYSLNDKYRESIYGGGLFTRLFPIKFLFAQAQVEHNWIRSKYMYASGAPDYIIKTSGNSILVGGGYTTGRDPDNKSVYGYLAVLFDVGNDANSPYKDGYGRTIPIIRAGLNVPLFQGHGER